MESRGLIAPAAINRMPSRGGGNLRSILIRRLNSGNAQSSAFGGCHRLSLPLCLSHTRFIDIRQTEVLGPVLTFQEHLNAVFPDMRFTMEEEEKNQLAFLDILLCRKDRGGLKTKLLRKATNTMQVLNFNSNHPVSHKRNCVRTLYRRVETHCSEPKDKIAELQYLRRVFKANDYPRNFVNRCIRKKDERPNRTGTKSWRALPYVKNVSEAVGRILAPLGVGVAHRPEATIRRQAMKPKDPLPRL
ncbi:hypothetical protein SprV_0501787900 [Sparganum proliferum]